jgi:cobalamin biosynthesis protein CobD/CbiB
MAAPSVRFIGKLIEVSEKYLRGRIPEDPAGELWAGALLVVIVAGISAGLVTLLYGMRAPVPAVALSPRNDTLLAVPCGKSLKSKA